MTKVWNIGRGPSKEVLYLHFRFILQRFYMEQEPCVFTETEMRDIRELRSRVQDVYDDEDLKWVKNYIDSDSIMWRFVLAKSMETEPMDAAELMFRNSILWRHETGILDKLPAEWRGGTGKLRWRTARARFGDLCFYGGVIEQPTVRGGPVLVERLGKIDLHGLHGDECG